jgi:hypothetical protein
VRGFAAEQMRMDIAVRRFGSYAKVKILSDILQIHDKGAQNIGKNIRVTG